MYIINGIAHASVPSEEVKIMDIKSLDDMMMVITFETGEKRLFDVSQLLQYPAFAPLADEAVLKSARIEWGVVTWCNGEIDIAPEIMYENSFPYQEMII